MGWFVLEQSQLTAYLDFRQLVHLCASTLSVSTNGLNFDNLDPSINWTMFDNRSMHSPVQRQSKLADESTFGRAQGTSKQSHASQQKGRQDERQDAKRSKK